MAFNNALFGGAGDDTLSGGTGNDQLFGGVNDDKLNGDAGNDTLYGESGNDTYYFSGAYGHDTINDSDGQGSIVIGTTTLGGVADSVEGEPTRWTLNGFTLELSAGDLIINPGATDRITIDNFDSVSGSLGITLSGGEPDPEDDTATGGGAEPYAPPGADTITGDEEDNVLYLDDRTVAIGNGGIDRFVIESNGVHSVQQLFGVLYAEAGETIDLSGFAGVDSAADITFVGGQIALYGNQVMIGIGNQAGLQIAYNTTLHDVVNGNGYNNNLFGGAGNDNNPMPYMARAA